MAISPVGNIIYTNQNTPIASNVQQAEQQRIDFQNSQVAEFHKNEVEKIKETNPPEELYKTNQNNKKKNKDEDLHKKKQKKQSKEKSPEERAQQEENPKICKLDIRV